MSDLSLTKLMQSDFRTSNIIQQNIYIVDNVEIHLILIENINYFTDLEIF